MVGISTVSIQTVGTWTGLLTPQVSLDGADWVNMNTTSLINVTTGAYSATIPSAAKQIYQADIAGFAYFRVTATPTAITGTATVYLRATNATGLVGIDNPLPPGTNSLGSVSVSSGTITTVSTANVKPILPVLVYGQTTSGTSQVNLNATSHVPTNGVIVQALSTNIASVFVGITGVTTSTGFELVAGQSITLTPTNSNLLYIIGANATDKVCWLVG